MSDVNQMTESDADELLAQVEAPSSIPMNEPANAAPIAPDEYAFTFEGKEIKGNRDQMLKWASQGYNAPNKIGELNQKLKDYSTKENQFKEWEQKYSPVDEYMKKNPQFWEHLQKTYQQQIQQSQQNVNPEFDSIKKELDDIKNFKLQYEQERLHETNKKDDEAYQNELQSLTKAYPTIDFNAVDQTGKSLEYKVLEHARDNGIKNFKTAFRDYYHDELIKMNSEQTKENLLKDKQMKSKFGILGESFAPTKKISNDVKGKSYADLEREALAELGINT